MAGLALAPQRSRSLPGLPVDLERSSTWHWSHSWWIRDFVSRSISGVLP